MKKGKIILILLIMVLMIKAQTSSGPTIESETNKPNQPLTPNQGINYVDTDPIRILNDSAFETNYGLTGEGTIDEPYLIDDLNISDSTADLIYIENTTKHFIISNCYLNSKNSPINSCVVLINVTNGVIKDNIMCNTSAYGMVLSSSHGNVISSNLIQDCNMSGIFSLNSSSNIILNNTINDCLSVALGVGIFIIENCTNNFISQNNISNCLATGILMGSMMGITYQGNNSIIYNEIHQCSIGVMLTDIENNTISNNRIYEFSFGGIALGDCNNNTIYYNTIYNGTGVIISAINIGGSNNTIIEYNNIYNNSDYGVSLDVFSVNNSVNWNNFLNNSLDNGGNSQIWDQGTNNNISYNYWHDYTGSGNYTSDGYRTNDTNPLTKIVAPRITIVTPLPQTYGTNTIEVMLSGFAIKFWYNIEVIDSQNRTWTGSEARGGLSDGAYTLNAYANILNYTIKTSVTFTIATVAPTVTITSPANTTYTQNSVTLTYTVSHGIVTIYVDGTPNGTAMPSGTVLSSLTEGSHNVTIIADDQAGHITKESVIFTVTILTPTVGCTRLDGSP